jgi:hypothetical protein
MGNFARIMAELEDDGQIARRSCPPRIESCAINCRAMDATDLRVRCTVCSLELQKGG